jgi:hypothetical protein
MRKRSLTRHASAGSNQVETSLHQNGLEVTSKMNYCTLKKQFRPNEHFSSCGPVYDGLYGIDSETRATVCMYTRSVVISTVGLRTTDKSPRGQCRNYVYSQYCAV